jgi:hypothetical protein
MSVPDRIDRRTLVAALGLVVLLAGMLVAAAGNAPQTGGYLSVERVIETPSDAGPTPFDELDPGQREQFKRALDADDSVRVGTDEQGFEFYERTYVEYRGDTYRVLVAAA